MEQPVQERVCPDCGGQLEAIKVFGRSWKNPVSGAAIDAEVSYYTDVGAERSNWLYMFEERGTIRATLCSSCGRVFWYGSTG